MQAKDVPVGSRVEWRGFYAWCLGEWEPHYEYVLLGWRRGETSYSSSWITNIQTTEDLLRKHGCQRGYIIRSNDELIIISGTVSISHPVARAADGEWCKLCRDFAPMAAPNRPDGKSFICHNCSMGWIPAGM